MSEIKQHQLLSHPNPISIGSDNKIEQEVKSNLNETNLHHHNQPLANNIVDFLDKLTTCIPSDLGSSSSSSFSSPANNVESSSALALIDSTNHALMIQANQENQFPSNTTSSLVSNINLIQQGLNSNTPGFYQEHHLLNPYHHHNYNKSDQDHSSSSVNNELEELKEKIMKLEQRNYELEKKLNNSNGGGETHNPNLSSSSIGASINRVISGNGLDTSLNNNNDSINNESNTSSIGIEPPQIEDPKSNDVAQLIKSISESESINKKTPVISNNNPNPIGTTTPLNSIPNINQGGFIITSNGSIAYVPPQSMGIANSNKTPSTSTPASSSSNDHNLMGTQSIKLDLDLTTSNNGPPLLMNKSPTQSPPKTTSSSSNNKTAFILSSNGQLLPLISPKCHSPGSTSPNSKLNVAIKSKPILPQPVPVPVSTSLLKKPIKTKSTSKGPNQIEKGEEGKSNPKTPIRKSSSFNLKPNLKKINQNNGEINSKIKTKDILIKPPPPNLINSVVNSNLLMPTSNITTMASSITLNSLKKHREIRPKPQQNNNNEQNQSNLNNLLANNKHILPQGGAHSLIKGIQINTDSNGMGHHQQKTPIVSPLPSMVLQNGGRIIQDSQDILAKAASMLFSPNEFNLNLSNLSSPNQMRDPIGGGTTTVTANFNDINQESTPKTKSIKKRGNEKEEKIKIKQQKKGGSNSRNIKKQQTTSISPIKTQQQKLLPSLKKQESKDQQQLITNNQIYSLNNFNILHQQQQQQQFADLEMLSNSFGLTIGANGELIIKGGSDESNQQQNGNGNGIVQLQLQSLLNGSFAQYCNPNGIGISNGGGGSGDPINNQTPIKDQKLITIKGNNNQIEGLLLKPVNSPELLSMPSLEQFFTIDSTLSKQDTIITPISTINANGGTKKIKEILPPTPISPNKGKKKTKTKGGTKESTTTPVIDETPLPINNTPIKMKTLKPKLLPTPFSSSSLLIGKDNGAINAVETTSKNEIINGGGNRGLGLTPSLNRGGGRVIKFEFSDIDKMLDHVESYSNNNEGSTQFTGVQNPPLSNNNNKDSIKTNNPNINKKKQNKKNEFLFDLINIENQNDEINKTTNGTPIGQNKEEEEENKKHSIINNMDHSPPPLFTTTTSFQKGKRNKSSKTKSEQKKTNEDDLFSFLNQPLITTQDQNIEQKENDKKKNRKRGRPPKPSSSSSSSDGKNQKSLLGSSGSEQNNDNDSSSMSSDLDQINATQNKDEIDFIEKEEEEEEEEFTSNKMNSYQKKGRGRPPKKIISKNKKKKKKIKEEKEDDHDDDENSNILNVAIANTFQELVNNNNCDPDIEANRVIDLDQDQEKKEEKEVSSKKTKSKSDKIKASDFIYDIAVDIDQINGVIKRKLKKEKKEDQDQEKEEGFIKRRKSEEPKEEEERINKNKTTESITVAYLANDSSPSSSFKKEKKRGRPPKQRKQKIKIKSKGGDEKEMDLIDPTSGGIKEDENGVESVEYAGLTRFEIPIPYDMNTSDDFNNQSKEKKEKDIMEEQKQIEEEEEEEEEEEGDAEIRKELERQKKREMERQRKCFLNTSYDTNLATTNGMDGEKTTKMDNNKEEEEETPSSSSFHYYESTTNEIINSSNHLEDESKHQNNNDNIVTPPPSTIGSNQTTGSAMVSSSQTNTNNESSSLSSANPGSVQMPSPSNSPPPIERRDSNVSSNGNSNGSNKNGINLDTTITSIDTQNLAACFPKALENSNPFQRDQNQKNSTSYQNTMVLINRSPDSPSRPISTTINRSNSTIQQQQYISSPVSPPPIKTTPVPTPTPPVTPIASTSINVVSSSTIHHNNNKDSIPPYSTLAQSYLNAAAYNNQSSYSTEMDSSYQYQQHHFEYPSSSIIPSPSSIPTSTSFNYLLPQLRVQPPPVGVGDKPHSYQYNSSFDFNNQLSTSSYNNHPIKKVKKDLEPKSKSSSLTSSSKSKTKATKQSQSSIVPDPGTAPSNFYNNQSVAYGGPGIINSNFYSSSNQHNPVLCNSSVYNQQQQHDSNIYPIPSSSYNNSNSTNSVPSQQQQNAAHLLQATMNWYDLTSKNTNGATTDSNAAKAIAASLTTFLQQNTTTGGGGGGGGTESIVSNVAQHNWPHQTASVQNTVAPIPHSSTNAKSYSDVPYQPQSSSSSFVQNTKSTSYQQQQKNVKQSSSSSSSSITTTPVYEQSLQQRGIGRNYNNNTAQYDSSQMPQTTSMPPQNNPNPFFIYNNNNEPQTNSNYQNYQHHQQQQQQAHGYMNYHSTTYPSSMPQQQQQQHHHLTPPTNANYGYYNDPLIRNQPQSINQPQSYSVNNLHHHNHYNVNNIMMNSTNSTGLNHSSTTTTTPVTAALAAAAFSQHHSHSASAASAMTSLLANQFSNVSQFNWNSTI